LAVAYFLGHPVPSTVRILRILFVSHFCTGLYVHRIYFVIFHVWPLVTWFYISTMCSSRSTPNNSVNTLSVLYVPFFLKTSQRVASYKSVTIQILTVTFLLIHGHNETTGAGRAIVHETVLGL